MGEEEEISEVEGEITPKSPGVKVFPHLPVRNDSNTPISLPL